jgi:hypothetical protein
LIGLLLVIIALTLTVFNGTNVIVVYWQLGSAYADSSAGTDMSRYNQSLSRRITVVKRSKRHAY